MAAIQNGNNLKFICTMLRDGIAIPLTDAVVTLRLQPRHNVKSANRPEPRVDIPAEIVNAEEGIVQCIYTVIDMWGKWKAQFKAVLPDDDEPSYSEPHEFEVKPNIGDETC